MSYDIPNCFYRVTVKGLMVQDEKILLVYEEKNDFWELPGGGLDHGETPQIGLQREIQEEMGLETKFIADSPTYVWSLHRGPRSDVNKDFWVLLVGYQMELASLDFTPSDECNDLKFFSKEELSTIPLNDQIKPLIEKFNPEDFVKR